MTAERRDDPPAAGGGKGRPTPKRNERVKRRSGPVAPPPATRKEAARRARAQAREQRQRVRAAQVRGDDRYLPRRDAGPVRRLARDVVDSRRNAGVLLLPIALLLVVAQITRNAAVLQVATLVWFAGLLYVFTDFVMLATTLRRRARERFPDQPRRGLVGYALLRSTVFRRWRMPAPAVSPGDRV